MLPALINALRPIQFRGKARLLSPLVQSCGVRTARVHGARMTLDLSDWIQRNIYLGCYERDETAVFKKVLRRGGIAVDVGANVGYFTALSAKLVGGNGRVLAFEPSEYAQERLQRMVRRNRLKQVTTYRVGLSDSIGSMALFVPPRNSSNHTPTMVPNPAGQPVDVPVTTLDEVLRESGIEGVNLMKVDVEGHEPRVLAGARHSASAGRIQHLLIELNEYWLRRAGSGAAQLLEQARSLGFELVAPRLPASQLRDGVHTIWMKHKAA